MDNALKGLEMTKSEREFQKELNEKVTKEDCQYNHQQVKENIEKQFEDFGKLIKVQLDSMRNFNFVHILGYLGIITSLVILILRSK